MFLVNGISKLVDIREIIVLVLLIMLVFSYFLKPIFANVLRHKMETRDNSLRGAIAWYIVVLCCISACLYYFLSRLGIIDASYAAWIGVSMNISIFLIGYSIREKWKFNIKQKHKDNLWLK